MTPALERLRPTLGAVAEELQVPLAAAQADALLSYLALLQRWNATYNLTAVRELQSMLIQHLADCLALVNPLSREFGDGPARLLDVGSGGGLPGAVVAILRAATSVTCVDAVGKKAAFVRQVAVELGLRNLEARHARVERLQAAAFDCVTARAFAPLKELVRLTRAHLAPAGVWVAMKGKTPTDELLALPDDIEVFHVEQLKIPYLDAERCLVWLRTVPGRKADSV